ncbi:MAG: SpaA isopeptide-forming pilin-related protein [Ezakiella coagulans]|uniref:SpaA isopeptide-forming pilin-related protein n=1 Tax=Ezakiella coagulans TaxID=46507 RepID=UPI00399C357C
MEAVELKNEDEDLKIYEPIIIEETENQYADLVTIGESDIDSIERVATEVTFDAVEYSFQNLYHTLETSSMLGFGQPRDFDVLLKATMKASRKIVKGDKFEVEILSKTLPILNGEEGRANDIQIDGKVVATAEYIAEEHKIVYTFVEDLDTDKVEIEQEFKQIKEEKAALLNMLDVSENLIADAVRGAEGIEDSEGNSEELEISPEDDNNTIKLVLGNTPVQYSGASFETKKFRLKTTMTAKAIPVWKIPKGWTFDVNIGSYLKPEYDNNSKPILKPLYDPDNPREVVAEPSYNEATHTITYKYVKDVLKTKKIDIDQLLAFDTKAIDDKKIIDVNITVTPKDNHEQRMPTITVRKDDPRTEIPSLFTLDVNQNGEPNLNDGYEFFEYGPSYKVSFNADASPVVENGKVTSINWTVVFDGNGESLNSKNLNLITNFTAVRNSGLKAIEEVNLNGQGVTLTDNDLGDKFLINDSKYFDGHNNSESVYTFKFKTKVDSEQKAYVLDIAAKLRGVKKTGAVRLIMPAYEGARLEMVSPNDMTYSNRTTISGKFTSEDTAEWILTEEVSSGDKGTLPLIERNISENQKLNSLNVAYYGLYNSPDSPDDGKMHQIKGKIEKNNPIAAGKLDGDKTFTPGTIAVYEYKTKLLKSDELQTYTLSDGVISKYRDVDVNVKWSKRVTDSKYPGETITLTSDENPPKIFSTTILKEEDNPVKGNEIDTKIKAVKLWNIDANGKPKKIEYSISQKFDETIGTNLQCGEVYKTYEIARGRYEIQNYISEKTNLKPGEININKQDENGRPLPGATFKIYGLKNNGGNNSPDNFEIEGTSDSSGSIKFTNIPPGVYTLQETKAPEGYEQNTRTDTITVRDDGSVEWTKNLISNAVSENTNQGTSWKSDVKYYNGSFSWPGYMNTLEYTEVDKNNNITSYIMLKPDVNSFGPGGTEYSSTDRSTRVSMFGDNLNITAVQIFDVGPSKREDVRNAMYSKTANQLSLGNDISGIDNKSGKIVKEANYTDGFLGKNVHAIMIPYKRFGVPNPKEPIENFKGWAFLIKITGKINDQNLNSTFSYRWLTMSEPNVNVFNTKFDNAKIEKQTKIESDTLIPALNKRNAAFAPTFTVVNTQAKRTTLNIQKLDDKNNQLSGAEFSLYNSFGQIIRTGTTEVGGKLTFDKLAPGKYTLKETKSPGGYYNPELTFNVFVNPDGSIIYDAVDKNGKQVEEGDLYKVGENNTGGTSGLQGTKRITVIGEPRMYLNESNNYGKRPRVWEEAAYESYSFEAQFNLENCGVGDSWVMDFDDNWNFTQWSGELPVLKVNDQEVAKGEIDYRNNQIKYTLSDTDYVNNHDSFQVKLELNSIRPSKYYVKNNGIYKFRDIINVGENQKRIDTEVNADLKQFYGQDGNVKYITENVDIYKDSSEKRYMMRNIALFNVFGKKYSNGDTVARIYYGSSVNNGREILFGDKQEPAFEPTKVVVYEVLETPNPDNMPLSCGIRPSENPGIYKPLATFDGIKGKSNGKVSDHGVTIDFDKSRVNIKDKYHPQLYDTQQYQFFVTLPVETKKEGKGYVIEQFYEITDPTKFENTYTQTFMAHKAGNYSSMGIAQMRPTLNKGAAIGGNVIIPQPKNYDLTVYNKKQPGEFIVKKVSEEKDNNGNNIPLSGAEFILLDSNGRVIRRNSSNKEGIVEFKGLSEGTYTLKETVPPDKHKATLRTVNVTVSAEGVVSFTGVENDDEIFQVQTNGRSRKVRKTSEQLNEEQMLSHHGGYPAFMNIYSKVIEKDGNHVKTRIYLNPDSNPNLGNGPNKKTVLELSASNTNQDITTAVYKVPRESKGNIDQYLRTNKTIPSTQEVNIISNKKIEFMSAGEPGRWNGAAYVIEINARYKEPNPDIGKTIVQDRYINYNWYCDPDFGTFMKGIVGTQLKVSNTEVDSSTPIGDGVVEINDSKKIIQVVNKKEKIKVTIIKVDEDNNNQKIAGAIFGLFDENGKEVKRDDKPYTVTTGKDGKATFKDLEPGKTYIIRELEAPKGYEKTNKTWTVVVGKDNTVEVTENSTVSKTVFGIDNPNTKAIGTWNFTYYQKHVLDVSPVIEKSGDGYVVNVNTKGTSYPNDNRYSQLNMYFDTEHFEFEDKNVNDKAWSGKYVYFNSAPNTYSFKFKPKANVEKGSYKPITGITYVNFPMSHEFLPTFNVNRLDGEKESNNVEPNKDGNEFSFNISNKYKGYEVEFKKIAEENGNEIKLTGAKFILQIKNGENYVDFNPVYTAISDAKGKIKFSGLKPGEYKVVETDPPAGYYVLNKDVKLFKIDDDGKVFIMENGEYKPQTDENIKILNSKPGDGKFKILKTDENNKGLQGVKFNLYNSRGDLVGEFTTDEKGEINFTNLPYDKYYVKEISTKPGYIVDGEVRVVLIGKKWEKGTPTGRDVSNELILNSIESKMTSIINDDYYITPNNSEVIQANLKYKVDENAHIQPGDTFKVVASENVDLDGIGRSHDDEYDIYGPAGLLATAEINDDNRREITYTFTEYAKHYDIKNINIGMLMAVNRIKVPGHKDGKDTIAVSVTAGTSKLSKNFNVQYNYGDDVQVNACLVKYDEDTDEFIANFYLNHKNINTYGKKIQFTSNSEVEFTDVQVEYLNNRNSYLPWSFGIKDSEPNLSDLGSEYYSVNKTNDGMILSLNGNYFDNLTYRVIVKGKVTKPNESRFALYGEYINYNERNQRYYQMVGLYKSLKKTSSDGDGDIELAFKNYKNKIEYTKVDGSIAGTAVDTKPQGAAEGSNGLIETPKPVFSSDGKALAKAEFKLKKDGIFDDESLRVSGEDGKFSWEGLAPGYYEVWETKAPDGYPTPKEKVSHFTVNKNGEIVDIKDNTTIIKNYKNPEIEFQKVDGENKSVKLKGAKFTLYMAEKHYISKEYIKKDGNLQFAMVDRDFNIVKEYDSRRNLLPDNPDKGYTVESSNEEGTFKFEKLKDGIYAVKETTAPSGYTKLLDYALIFKVEGGKIYEVNKAGNYVDKNKKVTDIAQANLLVDVESGKAQVNPIQIENFKAEYPATGGVGALPFVFIGMMIMMAGAYMFIQRRDALYE